MRNTKGQMHVLEVLLVGVLFTSAVNVAVNILPTSDADNSEQNDLYFSGRQQDLVFLCRGRQSRSDLSTQQYLRRAIYPNARILPVRAV